MAEKSPVIQAVVFDLDDTLFPERDFVLSGYRRVARHLAGGESKRAEELADFLWKGFLAGQAGKAFDALNEHFALALSAGQIAELVKIYREHQPDIEPYGGIPHMLGMLHEGHRLGLLSDGYLPTQRLKLQALELGRFFDAVVFTEELGRSAWKPSTRGFELIAGQLHADPHRCAYVADNPAKDFVAANRLGWRAIQYLRPGQLYASAPPAEPGRPTVVVSSPQELRMVLNVADQDVRLWSITSAGRS